MAREVIHRHHIRWRRRVIRQLATMLGSTKPGDQGPFRFLDLPAELRLMVYEYLVPHQRRHHKIHSTEEGIAVHPIIVVLPEPVSSIYRVCRVVYAEAVPLLATIRVPRINLDADHNLYNENGVRQWGPLAGLYRYINNTRKALQPARNAQEDDTPPWLDESRDYRKHSLRSEEYASVNKFTHMVVAYLGQTSDLTSQELVSSRRLQIALRGKRAWSGDIERPNFNWSISGWSESSKVPTIKYTVSGKACPDVVTMGARWAQYGGVMSQAVWDAE
ncbi:hypothetical protein BKA63DRAFT_603424 [Paraphoma chrysanthemicola]|nr:hypothetical protein BKA63DRAFT_603424 [Paraphoma chrysanthemicola]